MIFVGARIFSPPFGFHVLRCRGFRRPQQTCFRSGGGFPREYFPPFTCVQRWERTAAKFFNTCARISTFSFASSQIGDFGTSRWSQHTNSTGLATYTTKANQGTQMSLAWSAPEVRLAYLFRRSCCRNSERLVVIGHQRHTLLEVSQWLVLRSPALPPKELPYRPIFIYRSNSASAITSRPAEREPLTSTATSSPIGPMISSRSLGSASG